MREHPQFRSVGIGIVAENKPRNTHEVKVWLVEELPLLNDELKGNTEKRTRGGIDNDGIAQKFEINLASTSTAIWLGNTNRASSPDVRRGERVEVFKFGDSDIYLWDSLGMDDHLRRLETVVLTFNANPNNDNTEPSQDDVYYLEISTHDKHVTFHTSSKNGEACQYTVQLDTQKGIFTLEDDIGNYAQLKSVDKHWRVENADSSFVEINKKNGRISVPETLDIDFTTCNIKGKQMNTTVPEINTTGDITHKGNNTQTGNYDQEGNHTRVGTGTFTGASEFTGGVLIDQLVALMFAGGTPGGPPATFSSPLEINNTLQATGPTNLGPLNVNGTINASGTITTPNINAPNVP